MEVATIRAYLAALDEMRRIAEHATFANEMLQELAHPLNRVEELLRPIDLGHALTPDEMALRRRARRTR